MDEQVISKQKKEWVAPQCTVYGDVETLTLTPSSGHGGGGGWGQGGGGGQCNKSCGSCDCNRSFSTS